MTENTFKELKEGYIELIKSLMIETGGLNPSITVLGKHKDDNNNAIVHIPIPSEYMESDSMKDEFIDVKVPEIGKQVAKKFDVDAVAWASEAWLRVLDKKDRPENESLMANWKDLPIKMEVLIVNIESHNHAENIILKVTRNGKQVNADGDLVDAIELTELPDYDKGVTSEGRFTGLYKKFVSL